MADLSFDDLVPDAPGDNAPDQQSAGLSFDDLIPDQPQRPAPEGTAASTVRKGASDVGGVAGALYGAGVGTEMGAPLGPWGAVGGGIAGAVVGGFGGNLAEQGGKEVLGLDDSTQIAINDEAHPWASKAADVAAGMVGMNPLAKVSWLARGAGAAIGAGMEAGQEAARGTFDPTQIALSALSLGIAPSTEGNKIGSALVGRGEKLGGELNGAISRMRGSGTTYPKDNAVSPPDQDMLTTGDMDPATKAALAGQDEGVEASASPLGEPSPGAPQGAPQGTPNTADVMNRLQGGAPSQPETVPEPAGPETAPPGAPPQPETGSQPDQRVANTVQDPQVPSFDDMPSVDAGFPQAGEPVAVGENEATPMPKRAAAIQVSKANSAKPRLGLKGIKLPTEPETPASSEPTSASVAAKLQGPRPDPNPSDAQKEAGNYQKGHERLFGHDVSIETEKGALRRSHQRDEDGNPLWEHPSPADYGQVLGAVKGADGDLPDVYNLRNGDKHFIVDQKNPDTGKFDEHKIMANAKDLADARDIYLAGFGDGKGMARLHDITEVSPEEVKQWLNGHGKSTKKAYGAPVVAPKAEPKLVTTAVTKLREAGHNEVADAIEKMPVGAERIAATNRALRMMTNKTGTLKTGELKNARIRQAAPVVEGTEGVTARSKGEAANKAASLKAARDLFEAHAPVDGESAADTVARAQAGLQKSQSLDKYPFKMQVKQEPALWVNAAKLLGKRPSEAKVNEFLATEKLLRSGDKSDVDLVRKGNRAEADIARSQRTGDAAIDNAEKQRAARFDIPHEESEEMVEPKPVKGPEDLVPKGTRTVDVENPAHRAELAKVLNANLEPTPKWKELRDANRKKIATDTARQLADRQTAAAVGDAAPVPPKQVKDLSAEEKAAYVNKLNEATKKGKGLDTLPAAAEAKRSGTRDLLGDFINSEDGSVNQGKIVADLKKLAGSIAGKLGNMKLGRDYTKEPKAYHSQRLNTPEKVYNSTLSDALHQIDTENSAHENGLVKWSKTAAKQMDAPLREKLYFAHEEGKLGTLSPDELDKYNRLVKPLLDENDGLKTLIQALPGGAEKLGPDVLNHIYRVVKGVMGKDPLKPGVLRDPLGARNNLSQRERGTMLERKFVALERDSDGKRFVIQPNDKGYLLHTNGKALQIKDPGFTFSAGDKIDVAGNKYTMKDALTREIERNARGSDGKMMKYHHDAVLSAALANKDLAEVARHMTYLNEIKNDPRFQARSTTNGKLGNENGWKHPLLPEFEKYWVDPALRAVMDDYAKPGFGGGDSVDYVRGLSQAITKTIFWNPVIHPLNVAGHWFVGRGWDNLNVKALLKTAGPAFQDVLTQGKIQDEIRNAGGSVMYGQTLNKNFVRAIGTSLGHDIQENPSHYDFLANKFGIDQPGKVVKWLYDNSQKVMWAANDMMYTQHYLEFRNKGMSPEGAVRAVEKDIPNYRVTPTLMTSGHIGRFTSQMMQDPLLTAFGRYHTGIWNAYANTMAPMLQKGHTMTERVDAVGKLMALGALMFVAKPLADKFAQWATGDKHASEIPRGPLTIPADLGKAARGEDDVASALRATTTLSPMVSMALQLLRNKDFGDRSIIEPGDVRNAFKGSPLAAGKVASQGAEFVARNAISPLNVIENEAKKPNGSFLGGVRDQLLGIKHPSPKAAKFEAGAARKAEQNAMTRQRQGGRGVLEGAVDKLGFK